MRKWLNSPFAFAALSIFVGLVIGGIVLWVSGYSPLESYWVMLTGLFSRPSSIAYTIIKSTPLILTGLSVSFAFRTGLFNIGAEGQFIIGSLTAAFFGYYLHWPAYLLIPSVLILSMIAAGLWGGLAGYLKGRFGVNEVISTIMLNWIAFYFQNYIVMLDGFRRPESETSEFIQSAASITFFEEWKSSDVGMNWLAEHDVIRDFLRTPVNAGILIAILIAIGVAYLLNKTTFGYQLRAVGFNRHAAEFGGINVKKSIMWAMAISGALAGLGGATQVLGVSKNVSILATMEGFGFDGMAVALIGASTATGSVLAGFLFGGLKYSGTKLQSFLGAPSEVIQIMIGAIVLFVAMPQLIRLIKKWRMSRRLVKKVEISK